MVVIFVEGSEAKDATERKKREKRTKHQPTTIFVEDCHETSFKTFLCLAFCKAS